MVTIDTRTRSAMARIAAPLALLIAVTIAVLLVRASLSHDTPRSGRPETSTVRTTAVYVVAAGDTLAGIAQRYGTTVDSLVALNPDIDPVSLRIGQRIKVG